MLVKDRWRGWRSSISRSDRGSTSINTTRWSLGKPSFKLWEETKKETNPSQDERKPLRKILWKSAKILVSEKSANQMQRPEEDGRTIQTKTNWSRLWPWSFNAFNRSEITWIDRSEWTPASATWKRTERSGAEMDQPIELRMGLLLWTSRSWDSTTKSWQKRSSASCRLGVIWFWNSTTRRLKIR